MTLEDALTDETVNGWLLTPAKNLVLFLSNEMVIAGTTEVAIRSMCEMPALLSFVQDLIGNGSPVLEKELRQFARLAREYAELADAEVSDDMQRIRTHHLVAAWAAVETTTEHTLVNLVRRVPAASQMILAHTPSLKPRRVRTTSASAARVTVRVWEGLLPQVGTMSRYLEMLQVLGLPVTMSNADSQCLSEMAAVRNVLIHNYGIVDQKFLEVCCQRSERIGDRLNLDSDVMKRYFDAASEFAKNLMEAAVRSAYFEAKREVRPA